ncbi:MAG TPA: M15 family metallopeptidase, partial [Bacteroidales bacterium]|nr:M15 family metallopeptidase [Bacteroidales bacterium]
KHWYVANPQRGSLHNYGMAVDLTIQDEKGRLLDMGTDFDYFGHPAYSNMEAYYEQTRQLTKTQAENRRYLANLMRRAGFSPSSTEWWHYNACSVTEAKARCTIVK